MIIDEIDTHPLTSNIQPGAPHPRVANHVPSPFPFRSVLPPGEQNQHSNTQEQQPVGRHSNCDAGLFEAYITFTRAIRGAWAKIRSSQQVAPSTCPYILFRARWPTVQLKSFRRPEIHNDAFPWASSTTRGPLGPFSPYPTILVCYHALVPLFFKLVCLLSG